MTRRVAGSAIRFASGPGSPEQRLAAFVGRKRRLAERMGLNFDDDSWEVSRLLRLRHGRPERMHRFSLHFSTLAAGVRKRWPRPVADLTKAICADLLRRTSSSPLTSRRDAMRFVGEQLGERPVSGCTIADLDAVATAIRARYKPDAAHLRVAQLRAIAAFMQRAGLVRTDLANWREKRGEAACETDAAERARLPAAGFSEAIAKSFALAVTPLDVLVASACTVMQFVPSRINAMLNLDENCWNVREDGGVRRLLIRFPGEKGLAPCVKWVPHPMTSVAELAFRRMQDVTAEARAIKRWYDDHPDRLYLPERLEHLRGHEQLEREEASSLLGISSGSIADYSRLHGLGSEGRKGARTTMAFAAVERHILLRLDVMMHRAGGPCHHPLMLLKWRSAKSGVPSECMFQPVLQETVSNLLAPGPRMVGLFQRLGIDPSGTLRGNTHCWRHALTTAAVRGGLGHDDLADWFVRSHPAGTGRYDHSSDADFRDATAGVSDVFPSGRRNGSAGR